MCLIDFSLVAILELVADDFEFPVFRTKRWLRSNHPSELPYNQGVMVVHPCLRDMRAIAVVDQIIVSSLCAFTAREFIVCGFVQVHEEDVDRSGHGRQLQ